ncbi:PQQ-dependent dehydrogenase, methanol/ethanol family [Aliifodinibius sp. S!AR15-10]|uniref:PQQ-dependent dehydrogenase, methanol/ethanol family n=1 Tax=Aliifodinibius sp. S!AR15-10 TaxID=2950437 RepID=UPI00286190D3|nr:PQQ-dependent dehydrogenase, methanol/ethanol family [Aliifodinibius sp. S!AR15-10]MDR8393536.1 PQQ-dependent dehydrogenase, methanol/ethanol family [Aliifodinibius sp. S!AR15-10]
MKTFNCTAIVIFCLILLFSCAPDPEPGSEVHIRGATGAVDDDRLTQADADPGNWLSYGRNYAEDRYSMLDQITNENIDQLGLAWSYDTGMRGGVETTPLVVDGIMYLTGPWSIVYALDARTGDELWTWDPEVPRLHGLKACCDVVNRGAALYKGKVYVGTFDGRLVALDAANGEPLWSVATFDPSTDYSITGAPRAVKGNIIIGNGGAEFGVRGYVSAYDAENGDLVWRTYTVPGNPSESFESEAMEQAAETWSGQWWEAGGGGTVWDAMAYDPELNLLYVGTGNGSPWSRNLRSPGGGDNLYLSSILALNPDDGQIVWHYQTTPGDHWDFTATQPLILADLEIEDQLRKVIMQAPKNGFFFVIDRETGEFISAEAYVPVTWADSVDGSTGRPVERPEAVYGTDPVEVQPEPFGGHNWQPMAFNHETGFVYVPVHQRASTFSDDPNWNYEPGQINTGIRIRWETGGISHGALLAWDPVEQREAWRVPLAHQWNGGVLTTAADLVFQGGGDGRFVAYDARTGDVMWEVSTGQGIIGSPVTYQIDGDQYITIAAGWGGAHGRTNPPVGEAAQYEQFGRVLTFKLGGSAPMPKLTPRRESVFIPDIGLPSSPDVISRGKNLFEMNCFICHGGAGASEGAMPNLQKANQATHEAFEEIVLGGLREAKGMPSFEGLLTPEEVAFIQAYIVSEAKKTKEGATE